MDKKFKIIIIIILIAVIGVAGYFTYTSYASAEFDKNLKEAYGYYEARMDIQEEIDDMSENVPLLYYNNENSAYTAEKMLKKVDKQSNLVDKEINSLETAKNFAQTSEEKKYIELILKNKKSLKDWIINIKKGYEINLDYAKGNISPEILNNKFKKLKTEIEEDYNINDKNFDELREFLIKTPQLKDKLKKLGLEYGYIGESK